jgi:acetyltransferase-like isoleucine patch superfamily enzyme
MIRKGHLDIGSGSFLNSRKLRVQNRTHVSVGKDSNINARILFDRENARVRIGDRTFIGDSSIVSAEEVEIGNDVLISWGCTIVDHDSHSLVYSERANDVIQWNRGYKDWSKVKRGKICIQDKVWMGFNVTILEGVSVGEGAVLAAGCIVTKNVDPWTLVAGIPAKPIRSVKEKTL